MKETKESAFCVGAVRLMIGIVLSANSLGADYTLPGLGTRIDNPAELRVENVHILSE